MPLLALTVDDAVLTTEESFMRIATRDGRSFATRVTNPLDSPANPVGEAAFFDKTRGLCGMALSAPAVERLIAGVHDLGGDPDMPWLGDVLGPPRPPPVFD
ncbi:hypothetical protein BOQ54_17410 (plasmid) [Chelatococcus daeguensis]|uniref:Uncharacterized protein n=1 Tax=Chelatococcus daeguensis TaxID=444444 RepID=A0AAC9P125_9HYPH|nr:hypothetical protein [Chelatococcus daeguensis]APF39291.1 hypothetical protein BOQ54_17410 [Chelatococcus daeguensis]